MKLYQGIYLCITIIQNRSYDCLFEDCTFESGVIVHYYKKIAQNEMANIIVQSRDVFGNPIYLNFVSKIDERLGLLITTISDNTETMKELVEQIAAAYEAFAKDASAQAENGNKAAGARARKTSLEIEKAMKAFRKASLEAAK